jgi:hypothetical protein
MKERSMSTERIKILTMLKEGKISVEEAEKLLIAVGKKAGAEEQQGARSDEAASMKYLRIIEERKRTEEGSFEKHLNIRIPLVLLRAGARLHSVLPANVRERVEDALREKLGGIGTNILDSENMETLAEALGEEGISIEIERPNKTIKIFCE